MSKLFDYTEANTTLFIHLHNIRNRLITDVKPYVDMVQEHAKNTNTGMGNFSLIRMVMPVVETTARAMKIKPQELLSIISIPNPYLSWSIFRDVFMHNDEFEAVTIDIGGNKMVVNPAIGITFSGTPAIHTTTSNYQMLNVIGLYEGLIKYIDGILSDKKNDKKIKIVTGIEYLDHDNDEIKMIKQEIIEMKSKK